MSSNIQKFQLTQGGKNYILTTQIEGGFVKLTCAEAQTPNSLVYFGRFSLVQLQQLSKKFVSMATISQAQEFLNQSIENQKVSVQNQGNMINIVLYFQKEAQAEQIISTTDYNSQAVNYNTQPIEYNTVEAQQQYVEIPVTNTTTTETVENTYNYTIPETTNYEVVQDTNYVTTAENQTYENYDYGNYENYQNYENINIDTNTNTNYDFNLNNAVEVQQTQTNTYETTIQTPQVETLTLSLAPSPQEPKIDESKYLNEIAQLKNQIKILKEQITILKTQTVEKTIVKTTDNSSEILLLKKEIERLKAIQINFENYKRIKEEEISRLKIQIEELLKTKRQLEIRRETNFNNSRYKIRNN